jgi:hypothetical protein
VGIRQLSGIGDLLYAASIGELSAEAILINVVSLKCNAGLGADDFDGAEVAGFSVFNFLSGDEDFLSAQPITLDSAFIGGEGFGPSNDECDQENGAHEIEPPFRHRPFLVEKDRNA